jgi:hypothetical protein
LRDILGRYLRVAPAGIAFVYGAHGKPGLERDRYDTDLQFSIADSGGIALVAVTAGRAVGVDVEEMRPLVIRIPSETGISSMKHRPKILSMALCLPMSSAKSKMLLVLHRAALWTPPVALNTSERS